MSDKKISQLNELVAASVAPANDFLAIVDTNATETKKITAKGLIDGALNTLTANGILYLDGSNVTQSAGSFDGTVLSVTTVDATNLEVTNIKAKDGTSAGSIANSTGVVTLASVVLTTADINGGTIDGVSIGAGTRGAGNFTTLNANGNVTLGDATSDTITANGRFNTDLVPSTDNARDLGTSALQFKDVYGVQFLEDGSNIVSQADIGTAPNEVPLNQYLGTMAFQDADAITVGQIAVSGDVDIAGTATISSGTADGVLYLNGSKEVTSGSVVTYDGTTFKVDGAAVFNDSGADVDFRIESDTDANAFFLDGATGNVGIATTSPDSKLEVTIGDNDGITIEQSGASQTGFLNFRDSDGNYQGRISYDHSTDALRFATTNTERARITSDGNLLVGATSAAGTERLNVVGGAGIRINEDGSGTKVLSLRSDFAGAGPAVNVSTNDPLLLQTNNTERARIDASGNFVFNENGNDCDFRVESDGNENAIFVDASSNEVFFFKNSGSANVEGAFVQSNGRILATTNSNLEPLLLNRQDSDGILVEFRQANTVEGTISVSGATTSYNAFAGSHWSQLQDGSKPDILRGTVMESINELCEWPGEENERLPKCKISDTAGSKKVYGVFMAWDNDWTETNDMYVTAVGAFICRVNAGVIVQEGDLLESNGDGTARVQADDIIRSSTIGKVTSTVKTHEYDDGSYCVPTVLYCG
jgi:hypothetical protein